MSKHPDLFMRQNSKCQTRRSKGSNESILSDLFMIIALSSAMIRVDENNESNISHFNP